MNIPQRPASTGQLPGGAGTRPFPLPEINQGGFGAFPQPNHLPFPNTPLPPGQLPLPTQETINAHLAMLGQQFGGPFGSQFGVGLPTPNMGIPQAQGHIGPRPQMQGIGQGTSFQQFLAQQQQARAMAGQHGISNQNGNQNGNQGSPANPSATPRESERAGDNASSQIQAVGSNTNTTVHEGLGPNGSQWRMVINETPAPLPLLSNLGNFIPPGNGSHITSQLLLHGQHNNHIGENHMTTGGFRLPIDASFPINALSVSPGNAAMVSLNLSASLNERLAALETNLNNGDVPSEHDMWLIQINIHALMCQQPWLQGRPENPLIARYLNAATRASAIRSRLSSQTAQQGTGASIAPPPTHTERFTSPTNSPIVYLLSSPSGPHALLVSPSGMYSTPGLNATSSFQNNGQPVVSLQHQMLAQSPIANPADAANGPEGSANLPQDRQVVQQQEQQQQPNDARNVVRILIPLGGHLWLLLRLFGFVYLFTAGWRRIILLVLCAMVVFIAQTGVFQPLQEALWDPFRRHIEGLVPLGAEGRPAGTDRNAPGDQTGPDSQPNPRDMANRLLRERDDQQGDSMIRRNLRRAERATALFIASLVPGVGERHIAARDAGRRAEEEERTRRAAAVEEEARQRAEDATETDETPLRENEEMARLPYERDTRFATVANNTILAEGRQTMQDVLKRKEARRAGERADEGGNDVFTDAQESTGVEHNESHLQAQEPQHRHQDQSEQPLVEI